MGPPTHARRDGVTIVLYRGRRTFHLSLIRYNTDQPAYLIAVTTYSSESEEQIVLSACTLGAPRICSLRPCAIMYSVNIYRPKKCEVWWANDASTVGSAIGTV